MKKIILGIIVLVLLLSPQKLSAQTDLSSVKDTVNILIGRLDAGTLRLEKIANRISSRLQKIKSGGFDTADLDSQYESLAKQLSNLKSQLNITKESATVFLNSQDPTNDYLSFRDQAITVRYALDEILTTEKSLVLNMKQYVIPTAIEPTEADLPKE